MWSSTVFAGRNGAGKSTVLQALDFLSQLARGDIEGWLEQRGWSAADLRCKLRKESNITFTVSFQVTTGEKITWNASFNRTDLRCSRESVYLGASEGSGFLLRSSEQAFQLEGKPSQNIAFEYQGSILSALKD